MGDLPPEIREGRAFWLNPGADGKLAVTETRIHKHPKLVAGKWEKEARYTFENDKPVEIQ